MNIVVVIRQVPDLVEPLDIDASGAALDWGSLSYILNECDDHALEQGLLLKEAGGGTLTVVGLSGSDIDNSLFAAAAKGADRIVKIPCDVNSPPGPQIAAAMYAEAIQPVQADLVLVGVQAHSELDGVLAPLLAAAMGRPYVPGGAPRVVVAQGPQAVLIGGTSIGWDLAPMLATQLQAPLVTGCKTLRVDGGGLLVTAAICGGKMLAEVQVDESPAVLMVQAGAARPTGEVGQGFVETYALSAPLAAGAVSFDAWLLPEAGDIDITQRDVLIAVGRGIQHKDNVELAQELADALGGAVCASRPVVDQGWLPPTRQVGKSGMTVKPKLYLALGISGAPEHLEGMGPS
jgi:electron transfer flavoprotein alpha/beta subunit